MPTLLLAKELTARCISISRASLPNEACGLVGGVRRTADSDGIIFEAHQIEPVANAKNSPTTFALDGAGMIEAEQRICDGGNEVIGVWHSHPTSAAVPSVTDLADAAVYDPFNVYVHVIVSMQGFAPTVLAYRYGGEPDQPLRKYWLVRFGS